MDLLYYYIISTVKVYCLDGMHVKKIVYGTVQETMWRYNTGMYGIT